MLTWGCDLNQIIQTCLKGISCKAFTLYILNHNIGHNCWRKISSKSNSHKRYSAWFQCKQKGIPRADWDWSFLEYQRKSVETEDEPERKSKMLHSLRHCEATKDFYTESIKQINPLIQFDPEPNIEITEARVELYKISISFDDGGNINYLLFPHLTGEY